MKAFAPVLYIRFRKRVCLPPGQPVHLGQIAQLLSEPELEERLNRLVVRKPGIGDGNRILIDMMQVLRKVREEAPGVQIEHFGEPHALVEIVTADRRPRLLAVVLVWLLLFIGSGLAIMNFHADVSMADVHQRIYELITGERDLHPYLLQIPYSIGIGIGMVLFFNHLFRKKFNEEPSPLEVEMFMYQENMNQFVITEEYRKLHSTAGKECGPEAADKGEKGGGPDGTVRR